MRVGRHTVGLSSIVTVFIALALALGAMLAFTPAVSAQEIAFRVTKYTCETDPGQISPIADNAPEDCELTEGVSFSIQVVGTDTVLQCATDATGQCSVQVESESEVIVTEDISTVPAGYSPRDNPIETTAVTEFAGAVFVNLPTGNGNGETPTELPETGSGDTVIATSGAAGMLTVIAVVALLGSRIARRTAVH
ncbi:MAG TPA: hypothetical protein VGR22_08635 [Thermomicrobiales bacterium]|nr:hypothetical protein [Thermomicrobiales bacterium]